MIPQLDPSYQDPYYNQFPPAPAPPPASTAPAPGATPPPAGAPAGAPGSTPDPNAFRDAWYASGGKTNEDLKRFVAAHPEFGATVTGSKGSKVQFANGQAFQAVRSAGINGGIGPAWDDLTGGGGGAAGVGVGDFGSLAQGWDKTFLAPRADEIRATPGYQFALTEGVKALDTSAAAKGTALNGGQKKDILQYATGLADQTAQQKYQNALNEYMDSYQIFRNNGSDTFDRFNKIADRGVNAADRSTS